MPTKNFSLSSPPPTDDQVLAAFREHIDERAAAGNMLALAVSDLDFTGGIVTVTLDPMDRAGAQHWALLDESTPDPAGVFGVPVAFTNDEGHWLRRQVERVVVADVDRRVLSQATAGELLWKNLIEVWGTSR